MSKCLPTFAEILNRTDHFLTEKINHDWLLPYLFHAVKKNIQMWSTLRTIKEMSKCLPTFAEILNRIDHFLTEKINHGWLLLYLFHAEKKKYRCEARYVQLKKWANACPPSLKFLIELIIFFWLLCLVVDMNFMRQRFQIP